ncbi:MAG: glycosyl transferase [Sphingomonadales bacterium]|nr:glycosyl transferase [Sphingomonadales bacterium]
MPDAMQTYVINLDRSPERMAFVERRFGDLGLGFTRITATDGNLLSSADLKTFADQRPRDGKRGWRPGQIGCLMSHLEVWRHVAAAEQPYGLVAEDDVHLSDALPAFAATSEWIPPDAEIIRLETTGQWLSLGSVARKFQGRTVRRVRSAAWATGAYVIHRDAAARLLSINLALHGPVDEFLFNLGSSSVARSLVTYQLTPALAIQDKFNDNGAAPKGFGSDIETETLNGRLRGLAALRRTITSTLRGKSRIEFR